MKIRRLFFFTAAGLLFASVAPLRADPAPLPSDVQILTRKDFLGHNYFSVGDALKNLTTLDIQQDGSRGTRTLARMRGSSNPKQTLVLLDGRPLSHEFNGEVDLTQLPLTIVERIEINRGGSSVAYGADAVAGSINIVTSRPSGKGLDVDLGYQIGPYAEKGAKGRLFGRSYLGDATYMGSNEDSGGLSQNELYQTTSHFGNLTRSFKGKGYWGLEYFYEDSNVGVSMGTPVPLSEWNSHLEKEASSPTAERTQQSQHAKAYLASPKVGGGTFYATFTQSYRDVDDRATSDGLSLYSQHNRASTSELKWDHNGFEAGVQEHNLKGDVFPLGAQKVDETGVYALNKFSSGRWTAVPQIRFDHHSRAGDATNPRLVLMAQAGERLLISASGARAFRAPTFDELYFSSGVVNNPNLRFEKSWTSDAGVTWTPPASRVSVTGFVARVDNLIHPDAVTNQLTNGGTEDRAGVETEFSTELGKMTDYRHVTIDASYTYQNSRRAVDGATVKVPSRFSPERVAFIRLTQHLPSKMTFSNELRYKSEQWELDDHQGVRMPPYYVWNSRFRIKILEADLFFEIENVLGRRYADSIGSFTAADGTTTSVLSPQPDRTYWAGFSLRFLN